MHKCHVHLCACTNAYPSAAHFCIPASSTHSLQNWIPHRPHLGSVFDTYSDLFPHPSTAQSRSPSSQLSSSSDDPSDLACHLAPRSCRAEIRAFLACAAWRRLNGCSSEHHIRSGRARRISGHPQCSDCFPPLHHWGSSQICPHPQRFAHNSAHNAFTKKINPTYNHNHAAVLNIITSVSISTHFAIHFE